MNGTSFFSRGEDVELLQENLEMLREIFDQDAKEYGHRAYQEPKRKKTNTDRRPGQETVDAVRCSDWMKKHLERILTLQG
jgi:hypothetical protein